MKKAVILGVGPEAGLGSRLLVESYYGQTIQIWSALLTASLVAGLLVYLMTLLERFTLSRMGGRLA